MPALIEALQRDTSSSVRAEAAGSIGKLRPISQQAGYVLEQALEGDNSMRVRMSARTALWQYYLVGYRSAKQPEPPANQTGEPPLAAPGGPVPMPAPAAMARTQPPPAARQPTRPGPAPKTPGR